MEDELARIKEINDDMCYWDLEIGKTKDYILLQTLSVDEDGAWALVLRKDSSEQYSINVEKWEYKECKHKIPAYLENPTKDFGLILDVIKNIGWLI